MRPHRARPGLPTTIRVTFRRRAKPAISSAMLRPSSVTASAPMSAASRRLSAAWLRDASGSIAARGCSTYTANHLALSSLAILLAEVNSRAEEEFGLTHTRSRSSAIISPLFPPYITPYAWGTACAHLARHVADVWLHPSFMHLVLASSACGAVRRLVSA